MLTLYHGSQDIIEKPTYGYGKTTNDYGRGFYCTEVLDLAKEWAVTQEKDGYSNKYLIETSNLRTLHLEDYSVIHWLAILVTNRSFATTSPVVLAAKEYLLANYSIDTSSYDLICGWRADDSYFSIARAFLSNQISYSQLSAAIRLGNLGTQIMLKSEKAFYTLEYVSSEKVFASEWFARKQKRDIEARNSYRKITESLDIDGIYMRDILKGGFTNDDPRLR